MCKEVVVDKNNQNHTKKHISKKKDSFCFYNHTVYFFPLSFNAITSLLLTALRITQFKIYLICPVGD